MVEPSKAYSGFSVKSLDEAEAFYSKVLGLTVERDQMGMEIILGEGHHIFVYEKADHQPATFTILNFPVDDIDATVDDLAAKGVEFARYEGMPVPQDEKGILRGKSAGYGPDIAWFSDPSGNILSVQTV